MRSTSQPTTGTGRQQKIKSMNPTHDYDKPEWHHQGGPTWQAHPVEAISPPPVPPPPPDVIGFDPSYWDENKDAIVALIEADQKRYGRMEH